MGFSGVMFFAVWAGAFLFFAAWAGGVFCCLGGVRVYFFCCLGGGRVFLLLFGRGSGVHSLTGLPGSSSSDPATKKTKQQKKNGS